MDLHTVPGPKLMLIVLDGLGDRRVSEFDDKTPLEIANKPVMDKMASQGVLGLHWPLLPGIPVGSGIAHMSLFNYGLDECPGRGVLEALGAGVKLAKGDLAFRTNFASFDGETVKDRRAGRADFGLDRLTQDFNTGVQNNPFSVKIKLYSTGYRGALVISGPGLEQIDDTDPQMPGKLSLPTGNRTAKIVSWIHNTARELFDKHEVNKERADKKLLPANGLLLRGAGMMEQVEPFAQRNGVRAVGIADKPLYLGTASFVGMDIVQVDKDEDKLRKAFELWNDYDFFFVHYKKTDNAGHDGRPFEKRKEIEKIDKLLEPLLKKGDATVVITGDHATPCLLKTHSGDAVPLLIWGANVDKDDQEHFGERWCAQGSLGHLTGRDIIPVLVNLAGRMQEVGK
ncbi:MAG: 2,3-bisphosphoglycerate-independent phosphoglycerate mutase [Candidatus Altiarchaeota archaeon]|nr:2,3-bisphosphoglycerate-independent phosphoglycerate mutase [Candidatus Altiarchaeota archaeon]